MSKIFKETGNALFLILIAVALFAALAYAVTRAIQSKEEVGIEQISTDNGAEELPPLSETLKTP